MRGGPHLLPGMVFESYTWTDRAAVFLNWFSLLGEFHRCFPLLHFSKDFTNSTLCINWT